MWQPKSSSCQRKLHSENMLFVVDRLKKVHNRIDTLKIMPSEIQLGEFRRTQKNTQNSGKLSCVKRPKNWTDKLSSRAGVSFSFVSDETRVLTTTGFVLELCPGHAGASRVCEGSRCRSCLVYRPDDISECAGTIILCFQCKTNEHSERSSLNSTQFTDVRRIFRHEIF